MKRITVPEEGIETLFGSYDENLKHLESLFNVRIRTQGHELLVEGESPDLDKVNRIVDQLSSLMRDGYKLSKSDVKTASDRWRSTSMWTCATISSKAASRRRAARRAEDRQPHSTRRDRSSRHRVW